MSKSERRGMFASRQLSHFKGGPERSVMSPGRLQPSCRSRSDRFLLRAFCHRRHGGRGQSAQTVVPICLAALGVIALAAAALADPGAAASGRIIAEQGGHAGVAPCAACHGASGAGQPAGGIPRLAGLDKSYLERELAAFRTGVRSSPVMTQYARTLTPDQIDNVTAYYASLPTPPVDPEPAVEAEAGKSLAAMGRPLDGLPACATCHGGAGEGYSTAPALAGQSAAYIAEQLNEWRQDKRPEGPDFFMSLLSRKLSEDDVEAVARYYEAMQAPASSARAEMK